MASASTTSTIRRPLALAWGAVALATLAIPLQRSGAAFTSQSINPAAGVTAAPDWTPPVVDLADPVAVRNGTTVTTSASDAETGVASVTIAWAPAGTTTFTTICTRTTAPYSCNLTTAGMPAEIDLQAVATDNAGYSATDLVEGVTVDDTAPTGSVTVTTNQLLAGVATIPATASDVGSGVASVTIQRSPVGSSTWTTICTDAQSPWSCAFDTTAVADGSYVLRALVTDVAGNVGTTAGVTVRVDNTQSTVSVDQPAPFLRGTVDLVANASSRAGVTSVRIEYARTAVSATWTALCTDTTSPYACAFDTTKVADGDVWFRAVLLDGSGRTTTSATVASRIDNALTRGHDVQAANGAVLGSLGAADKLTVTYTRQMLPASIAPAWNGSPVSVVVRVRDGGVLGLSGSDDTLDVLTATSPQTAVNLGSVNLRGNHVRSGRTVTMTATMSQAQVVVNGQTATAVTLTFTSTPKSGDLRTATAAATMVWTPSSLALDTTGAAASGAPVSELGTSDRDL